MAKKSKQAFPNPADCDCSGISRRDYFAAHVLSGIVSSDDRFRKDFKYVVKKAFEIADEMESQADQVIPPKTLREGD